MGRNGDNWMQQTNALCKWCWYDADGTTQCDAVDAVAADADAETQQQMVNYFSSEWNCDAHDFEDCDARTSCLTCLRLRATSRAARGARTRRRRRRR